MFNAPAICTAVYSSLVRTSMNTGVVSGDVRTAATAWSAEMKRRPSTVCALRTRSGSFGAVIAARTSRATQKPPRKISSIAAPCSAMVIRVLDCTVVVLDSLGDGVFGRDARNRMLPFSQGALCRSARPADRGRPRIANSSDDDCRRGSAGGASFYLRRRRLVRCLRRCKCRSGGSGARGRFTQRLRAAFGRISRGADFGKVSWRSGQPHRNAGWHLTSTDVGSYDQARAVGLSERLPLNDVQAVALTGGAALDTSGGKHDVAEEPLPMSSGVRPP